MKIVPRLTHILKNDPQHMDLNDPQHMDFYKKICAGLQSTKIKTMKSFNKFFCEPKYVNLLMGHN